MILNNSKVMGTSQLGGVVYGNPNLNQNAVMPPNTKAFRWLRIKSRVKGFLRVRINIIALTLLITLSFFKPLFSIQPFFPLGLNAQ
jgi:hypothetical protein